MERPGFLRLLGLGLARPSFTAEFMGADVTDDPLRTFIDEFVPNIEGAPYHGKWARANPGENVKWLAFRDALIAGQSPAPPSMDTKYGRALVAAGKEQLSISQLVGIVTNPNPTPDPAPAPPPGPSEPPAIAGQGYSVVFEDDFDTLDTSIWRLGVWYQAESPANYSVSNSILSIFNHPAEGKQRDIMSKAGYSWQRGYFEVRMRYTRHVDAWASTWMMSENWITTGNCTTFKICEFDMLESNHQFESPLTYRSHFGAAHRNTTGQCGMADTASPFSTNWTADTGMETADQWRTYAGLWTATSLKWYLDDVLLKSYATPDTFNQPMRWFLGQWSHNFATELRADIDWCRVWQQA